MTKLSRVLLAAVMLCALSGYANAQSFEVVSRFATSPAQPNPLVEGPDHHLYGTTSAGGDYGRGTVFRIESDASVTVLHTFTGPDGTSPVAGLTLARDGYLYGTTSFGPGNGPGTIFRIGTDGSFSTLHFFVDGDPGGPDSTLVDTEEGFLFGTGSGNIAFRVDRSTGQYQVLHRFDIRTEGLTPSGLVRGTDGYFYGTLQKYGATLSNGNISGFGSIFRMDLGGNITLVHRFLNFLDDVKSPQNIVQGADGFFYGTSAEGSFNEPDVSGTLFKMDASGNITRLHAFTQADQFACPNNSADDCPSLLPASDGSLYGTMKRAGGNGFGAIFKLDPTGAYSTIYNFDSTFEGGLKTTLILASDGWLYGAWDSDSPGQGYGGVYRSTTAGAVQVVKSFATEAGITPMGPLTQGSDGRLYGTTAEGGANNRGVVFRLESDGQQTVLHSFAGDEPGHPSAGLLEVSPGLFFGTTDGSLGDDAGSIFSVTSGGTFHVVHLFDPDAGGYPFGNLIIANDGYIYGVAGSAGPAGQGSVFRTSADGSSFQTLHVFEGGETDAANPAAGLIQGSDGFFYGTSTLGGAFNSGTVYRMDALGNVAVLYAFGTDPDGMDGYDPDAGLVEGKAGKFYGTTTFGGYNGVGTVFEIDAAGNFAVVAQFGNDTGGESYAPLVFGPDHLLYGTTSNYGVGSDGAGQGTVFRVGVDGLITPLHRFEDDGGTGAKPFAGLVRASDGLYYGTTSAGAVGGVIYRLDLGSETPEGTSVEVQPVDPVSGASPVNLNFGEITTAGQTSITVTSDVPNAPPTPGDFTIAEPPTYIDVVTTATFSGDIQVCFDYTGLTLLDPASAVLLHFNGSDWDVLETTPDPDNHRLCGTVSSLSPFAVGNVKKTPEIIWENPAAITYPTPLSATQLNASTTAQGTLIYSPPAGSILAPGLGQTLSVTFVPADSRVWTEATATVSIDVLPPPLNQAPVAQDKAVTVIVRAMHTDDPDDQRDHDRYGQRSNDGHGWNVSGQHPDDDADRQWESDADAGRAVRITLSATDADSLSLSFAIVSGPSHGLLSRVRNVSCSRVGAGSSCTARVIYFVNPHYAGSDIFTYVASDGAALSNVATVSINLVRPFQTFSQGEWGSSPNGNTPGAFLAASFSAVYPSGVVIGSNGRTMKFTSAAAVRTFFPSGGKPAVLPSGPGYPLINPASSKAGVLAGNVLALQLNADFSAQGKTRQGLGDLHLSKGKLVGFTVSSVLGLANQVLGGGGGLPSDVTLNDLNDVIATINANFHKGKDDDGYLIP